MLIFGIQVAIKERKKLLSLHYCRDVGGGGGGGGKTSVLEQNTPVSIN